MEHSAIHSLGMEEASLSEIQAGPYISPVLLSNSSPPVITSLGTMASVRNNQSSSTSTITKATSSKATNIPNAKKLSRCSQWTSEWISNWWGIELLCWVISALSISAIVIAIESVKNQPRPEWSFGISLNTLISIFATIGQMAMMKPIIECISQLKWLWFIRKQKISGFQVFDDASRGPTGCLLLLGKLRGLHLVSLGAIVTIISTGFGSFAQQIVSYPSRLTPIGDAWVPQVLNYTSLGATGPPIEELIASANNGLTQGNSSLSDVAPLCNTGNCTWDLYSSLAICSSIVDISSTLKHNVCNLTAFNTLFSETGVPNPGFPCFNYTIPKPGLPEDNSVTATNATVSNSDFDVPGFMQIMSMTAAYGNLSTLATSYLLYQPGLSPNSSAPDPFAYELNSSLPNPIAYELSLNLCIQTYNTSVSNGRANTTSIKDRIVPISYELIPENLPEATFILEVGNITATEGENTFGISDDGLDSLVQLWEGLFDFTCSAEIPLAGASLIAAPVCDDYLGNPIVNALTTSADPFSSVASLWGSMAVSLTNTFREGPFGMTVINQFTGTARAPVAFVETNYLWLIFPIGLVSLTLVFLLATILKSQRLGSRIWKSSNLATLQALHENLHIRLGGLSSITEMEETAKNVEIRLNMEVGKEHNGEYKFVESKQSVNWK